MTKKISFAFACLLFALMSSASPAQAQTPEQSLRDYAASVRSQYNNFQTNEVVEVNPLVAQFFMLYKINRVQPITDFAFPIAGSEDKLVISYRFALSGGEVNSEPGVVLFVRDEANTTKDFIILSGFTLKATEKMKRSTRQIFRVPDGTSDHKFIEGLFKQALK